MRFQRVALPLLVVSIVFLVQQCSAAGNAKNGTTIQTGIRSLYKGLHNFSYRMLNAINMATPNENIFFSPISTYHALLLAYMGSRGKTETSLRQGLNLNWSKNKKDLLDAYRYQLQIVDKKSKLEDMEFSLADKIYISSAYKIKDFIKDDLHHEVESLNFEEKSEESRQYINSFIEHETRNNIKDILIPGAITPQTNLVLANAAFFKGDWEAKFNKSETKKDIFHISSNEQVFTDMMSQTGHFDHAVSETLQSHILKMPYKGENTNTAMYIFLPALVRASGHGDSTDGITNFLRNLNYTTLRKELKMLYSKKVMVKFPKFSYEKTVELVPVLRQMGIENLFGPSGNLTDFVEEGNLSLDDAVHKAKIQVDEDGSTAAAATVLFSFRSSRPLEPTQFYCTQPFVYMIYDTKENLILFTGIYRRPE